MDLALNNLQRLICHKTQPTNLSIYLYIYIYIYICTHTNWTIGLMSWVLAYGLGDQISIPGRVIPKTQKMVLDSALLNTQHHKVRIKDKSSSLRNGVAPFPTPRCCNYLKGSLRVTLDYGRQHYLYIYIKK